MGNGVDGTTSEPGRPRQDGFATDPLRASISTGAPTVALADGPEFQFFEPAFRASPVALAIARDAHCRVVLRNAAMNHFFPASLEWQAWRLPDGTVPALFEGGEPLPLDRQPLRLAAFSGERSSEREIELRWPGREPVFLRVGAEPLFDAQGASCGAVEAVVDISAERCAEVAAAERTACHLAEQHDASAAGRAKDELIAVLGHELRNPMNAIVTAVEVLNRADPGAPEAQSARRIIGRQTRRLAQLMGDLSEVGQAVADSTALACEPIELGALLRQCLARAAPAAQAKGQRLVIEQAEVHRVAADPARLSQALDRLLEDAVQSTPDQGVIELRLRRSRQSGRLDAVVEVRGVAEAGQLPPLLPDEEADRPSVVDIPPVFALPGSGIGLSLTLVRRIVEQHGGRVDVRRHDAATGGVLFAMRLPALETTLP